MSLPMYLGLVSVLLMLVGVCDNEDTSTLLSEAWRIRNKARSAAGLGCACAAIVVACVGGA